MFKLQSFHKRDRWFKILVYGANGTGKTELAGTSVDVPAMCDVFLINAEKGEMTIETTDRIKNKEALAIANVDDITACEQIKQWLQAHCKYRDEGNTAKLIDLEKTIGFRDPADDTTPPRIYKTVIVDSITEVQAFAMYNILGISTNLALDADLPDREWTHYNKILQRVEMFARAFRDMPINVVMICQENYTQDEQKKRIFAPQLEGKMSQRIQGYFDAVGHLGRIGPNEKGDFIHRLFVQPVDKHSAKNRAALKVEYLDNPTLTDLFRAFGLDLQQSPKEVAEQSAS